jgi:hypothetical protein
MKKIKIKIIQLKRTKQFEKTLLVQREERITNTKYIVIDEVPIEVKPEQTIIQFERNKAIPIMFINDNYEVIDISNFYPITKESINGNR